MILICLVLLAVGVFMHYVAISLISVILGNMERREYFSLIINNFLILGCLVMGMLWESVGLCIFLEMLGY